MDKSLLPYLADAERDWLALAEAATPGPWEQTMYSNDPTWSPAVRSVQSKCNLAYFPVADGVRDNAAFIAARPAPLARRTSARLEGLADQFADQEGETAWLANLTNAEGVDVADLDATAPGVTVAELRQAYYAIKGRLDDAAQPTQPAPLDEA